MGFTGSELPVAPGIFREIRTVIGRELGFAYAWRQPAGSRTGFTTRGFVRLSDTSEEQISEFRFQFSAAKRLGHDCPAFGAAFSDETVRTACRRRTGGAAGASNSKDSTVFADVKK